MTWKKVVNSDAGDADHFGGNDVDKISDLFSGIDVDDVDINGDWKFRNGKLQIANPANTFKYVFVPSAITADRNITLPLITGTDTLAVLSLAQTLSNKTLDSTNTISSTASLPSTVVTEDAANTMGDFDTKFKDNRLKIFNPADTFAYTLTASAITADRDLVLPLISTSDTIAVLGLAQTFTEPQKIAKNTNILLTQYRADNTVGNATDQEFHLNSSTGVERAYGRMKIEIEDNTNTLEDGIVKIGASVDGSLVNFIQASQGTGGAGVLGVALGGQSNRVIIAPTGLTSPRTMTFPDIDTQVTGLAATQTNTGAKTFNDSTLKLRNPANTFSYTVVHGAITADRNATMPVLTANDIFTFNDTIATLKNKTFPISFGTNPDGNSFNGTGITNPYLAAGTSATVVRDGIFIPMSSTTSSQGLLSGPTAIGSASTVASTTEGLGQQYATGAVANNNAGLRWTVTPFRREWGAYMILRVLPSSTSDIRVFIGWSSDTAEIAGETTLNNFEGCGVGKRTGDTNWFTYANDGDATEDRVDTGITFAASAVTIELALNSTNFRSKIGTTTNTAVTTELPAAATNLSPHIEIETGAGAADKNIQIFPIYTRSGAIT